MKNIVRKCDAVIAAASKVFLDVYSAVWNLVCFTEEDVISDYAETVTMLGEG